MIVYEPLRTDPNAILTSIAKVAELDEVLDEVDGAPPSAHVRSEIFSGARTLDDVVLALTGGRADLRAVVAGALFAGSVYTLVMRPKNKRAPRWDNLLWWSFSVLSGDVAQMTQGSE